VQGKKALPSPPIGHKEWMRHQLGGREAAKGGNQIKALRRDSQITLLREGNRLGSQEETPYDFFVNRKGLLGLGRDRGESVRRKFFSISEGEGKLQKKRTAPITVRGCLAGEKRTTITKPSV